MTQMEEVENLFLEINKMKADFHFSCDLYFDDIGNKFVCKISNMYCNDGKKPAVHFRNNRLVDAMIDAYSYLKKI